MSNDRPLRPALVRVAAATALALAFSWGVYALLSAARPDTGPISFAFLLVLPAAVCGFVAYVADPWKTRSHRDYLAVPLWLLAAIVLLSLIVLKEGVICVILLSPLWLVMGLAGAEITYRLRRRVRDGRAYSVVLFALPLIAMQVEPLIPVPVAEAIVTRSIIVHASPARLWPLMKGIPDVQPGEGGWNVTQDIIGVPRPLGARLVGSGVGADRYARWEHGVRFRERIIAWSPGHALAWRFLFDDLRGWGYTDHHLLPDSAYFRVTDGGYETQEIAPGVTRLTLRTRYRLRTPVNLYGQAWGELFLGDLETNLLALLKHRAERPAADNSALSYAAAAR